MFHRGVKSFSHSLMSRDENQKQAAVSQRHCPALAGSGPGFHSDPGREHCLSDGWEGVGLWPQVGTGVCKRLRTDAGVAVAGHDPRGAREMGCQGNGVWTSAKDPATGNFRQKRDGGVGVAGRDRQAVIRLKLWGHRKEGTLCGLQTGFVSSSFQSRN